MDVTFDPFSSRLTYCRCKHTHIGLVITDNGRTVTPFCEDCSHLVRWIYLFGAETPYTESGETLDEYMNRLKEADKPSMTVSITRQ